MEPGLRYTSRTDELVVQDVGDELLIYDRSTDVAHCLAKTAAVVWRTCKEGASLDDLTARLATTTEAANAEALAIRALEELADKGLLSSAATGVSRRQALKRMAGAGIAATAAPLVVSAAVATPAQAQSTLLAGARCDNTTVPCPPGTTCTAGNTTSASGGAQDSRSYCSADPSGCTRRGYKPDRGAGAVNCNSTSGTPSTANSVDCCSLLCQTTSGDQQYCA